MSERGRERSLDQVRKRASGKEQAESEHGRAMGLRAQVRKNEECRFQSVKFRRTIGVKNPFFSNRCDAH